MVNFFSFKKPGYRKAHRIRKTAAVPVGGKRFRIYTGILVTAVMILGLYYLITLLSIKPPLPDLNDARKSIEDARKSEAEIYVPDLYRQAEKKWKLTQKSWEEENKKWAIRKNYQSTRDLARETAYLAKRASSNSVTIKDSLQEAVRMGVLLERNQIKNHQMNFSRMPINDAVKRNLTKSELLIRESELALERKDYHRAAEHLEQARHLFNLADARITETINRYYSSLTQWQEWVKESIEISRKRKSVAVIIEKTEHILYVYQRGQLIAEFEIELGPNWMGRKRHKGDDATPEGVYSINKKRQRAQTKYYKALDLNYPNQRDVELFEAEKYQGLIPVDTPIGGLIEIHGDGGRGFDWTDGCIALKNSDMDLLFEWVGLETPVTIVGAIKDHFTLTKSDDPDSLFRKD